MSETVSDFFIKRLSEWGVKRIYGYPGDGINGLMGALDAHSDLIDFIQVRHEEMAAFMACAHAKFTGEVGICMATSGPGAIHLLNGLYDAKMDHQPVVAIIGQQARSAMGGFYQQEVDLISLFKDVAHEFVQMLTVPEQAAHLIDGAMRIAQAERTVTCIIVPNDVQELKAAAPARKHGSVHSGIGYENPRIIPKQKEIEAAAKILNEGKKIAILVGAGARSAADEVLEVAEILGAGVAKALLGKAVLPDDLPFVTGAIGLLGTKPSYDMMAKCDTLLMIGSGFPYSEFLPKEGQARGVQIDLDARMLNIRYPMEVALHGDSAETLRLLLPLLKKKEDQKWRNEIEEEVKKWWKLLEARAMEEARPINPQRLFWELSPRLPDNCIIAADSGSVATWFARDLKIRRGMMASLSGTLATMGPGVPYCVAAKFAFPDRVAIALVGDGAMQMIGNTTLVSIAKYWKKWSDPRLVIVVLNNRDLNMVSWEMRAMGGRRPFEASQELPDFPYAEYAELLGLKGIRVEDPDNIGAAWDEAFASDCPVVVDVYTDPDVPMLPPHISFEQAKSFASSLLRRDMHALGVIKQTVKDTWPNLVPH